MNFEGKSRRLRERLELPLPIRVYGQESAAYDWVEVTRLADVTPFGARFTLAHLTEPGRLLHLTMPMPRQLRCFDHVEQQYRVWALIRHLKPLAPSEGGDAPRFEVGVAFVGKRPPPSYEADPTTRYEIDATSESGLWTLREQKRDRAVAIRPGEPRPETRLNIPIEVVLEALDEKGQATNREQTVTENISSRGAAVFSMLEVERGRFVRLTSAQYQISVYAAVRARRLGPDGIPRLHVEFVDKRWPLEGLQS